MHTKMIKDYFVASWKRGSSGLGTFRDAITTL
jgi:hypothetical protein